MEGLLIAEVLARLGPRLPSRRLAWRFPDPFTAVLPLERGALWLFARPPHPRLALLDDLPEATGPHTGFQEQLVARAAGDLVAAEQLKLDRVVRLRFGASRGFVEGDAVVLVAELTGRNCNLILTDEGGTVLGALREVGSDVNRFRQVRAGLRYAPPPPYDKLDPRTADDEELRAALRGRTLKRARQALDGLGPEVTRALAVTAGVPPDRPLEEAELERVLSALHRLVEAPGATVRSALGLPDVEELRRREARAALAERLEHALGKRLALVDKRLRDVERTREAAAEAARLREEGDLLLAKQAQVAPNVSRAVLSGWDGEPRELELDPRRDAVGNAQERYAGARKREARAAQADERELELLEEREELEAARALLGGADLETLEALQERWAPARPKARKRGPGVRYRGPHGFEVVVGRNSRENDEITFKVARSRDLWLHAQGYRGSHVVVLANNREVPFDTVLFAAQLAAAYSKAGESDNVPVDYTLRKNVWKVKGMPAGAVHFTQHKTVYVTPSRSPGIGSGSE